MPAGSEVRSSLPPCDFSTTVRSSSVLFGIPVFIGLPGMTMSFSTFPTGSSGRLLSTLMTSRRWLGARQRDFGLAAPLNVSGGSTPVITGVVEPDHIEPVISEVFGVRTFTYERWLAGCLEQVRKRRAATTIPLILRLEERLLE